MDGDKRVILNSFYIFLGTALANLGGFGFRIVVGREFGPEGLGLFSQAMLIIGVSSTLALIGLNDGIVKFVSQSRNNRETEKQIGTILTSLSIVALLSILLTTILYLYLPYILSFFNSKGLGSILRILIFLIPLEGLISLGAALFLAYERADYQIFIRETFPRTGVFIIAIYLAWIDGTVIQLANLYLAVYLLGAAFSVGASIQFLRAKNILTFEALRTAKFRPGKIVSFSFPLLITGVIGMFLNWTDVLIIGYFLGNTEIGIYQSAFFLGTSVAIFQGVISQSMYPDFGLLASQGENQLINKKYLSGIRWTIILTVPPVVYLSSFSSSVLSIIFGPEFSNGAIALIILSISQLIIASMGPATNLLKIQGASRFIAISYSIGFLINIILNVILVPVIGIIGAAVGTAAGFMIAVLLHLWKASEYLSLSVPIKTVLLSLGSAGVSATVGIVTIRYVGSPFSFISHIAIFSAIYTVCALLSGLVKRQNIKKIFNICKQTWEGSL